MLLLNTVNNDINYFNEITRNAYETQSSENIIKIAELYSNGRYVTQNTILADYILDLAKGIRRESVFQYRKYEEQSPEKKKSDIFQIEEKALEYTKERLNAYIQQQESKKLQDIWGSENTAYLDHDQKRDVATARQSGDTQEKNDGFNAIYQEPYYRKFEIEGIGVYYIGDDNGQPYGCDDILSSYSPVAKQLNDKCYEIETPDKQKHKLLLNRRIEIKNSLLIDVADVYNSKMGIEEVTDPFLTQILLDKRNEKSLTSIIKSIQANQNQIMFYNMNESILVQGCAGSGKTMILLHRLKCLMYNNPNYNWNAVKIITPNEEFDKSINDLRYNLQITQIETFTLQKYYLSVIDNYCNQKEDAVRDSNLHRKNRIKNDEEWRNDFVFYTYSSDFREALKTKVVQTYSVNPTNSYYIAMNHFDKIYAEIMFDKFGDIVSSLGQKDYTCTLYARVLYLYLWFGAPVHTDSMLFIDEGQDIGIEEYRLLNEVNGNKARFNIYGDIKQKVQDSHGITSWQDIPTPNKCFALNENYRNSKEIVKYYNQHLGLDNQALGVNIRDVEEHVDIDAIPGYLYVHLLLQNRVVIIYKENIDIPIHLQKYIVYHTIEDGKISIMTVKEAKGLEFDVVFVYNYSMSDNEKYIAYTRALSELYIINDHYRNSKIDALKEDFLTYIDHIHEDNINSYELVLTKIILSHIQSKKILDINDVVQQFNSFYKNRKRQGLIAEKKNLAAANNSNLRQQVLDAIKKNNNRFYYYDRDNQEIKLNYYLQTQLSSEELEYAVNSCDVDIKKYFDKLS